MKRTIAWLAGVSLVVSIGACTENTDEGGDGDAGVEQAFAAKVSTVCDDALAAAQAQGPFPFPDFNPTQPDESLFDDMVPYLSRSATAFDRWLDDMNALGSPNEGTQAWGDLVDAVAAHARIAADQADAAASGDAERFTSDFYEGIQTQEALLQAATDAGVPDCAKVDR